MEALFEKLKSLRSSKDDQESTPGMVYLLVGLGNPGREYRDSRHNVGFMAIDRIASAWDVRLSRAQSKAILGNGVRLGKKVILAKPQTYMNLSGESARYVRIEAENVGICPDWHPGAGGKTWIFVDEIVVE